MSSCRLQTWLRPPLQLHPVTVLSGVPQQEHAIAVTIRMHGLKVWSENAAKYTVLRRGRRTTIVLVCIRFCHRSFLEFELDDRVGMHPCLNTFYTAFGLPRPLWTPV